MEKCVCIFFLLFKYNQWIPIPWFMGKKYKILCYLKFKWKVELRALRALPCLYFIRENSNNQKRKRKGTQTDLPIVPMAMPIDQSLSSYIAEKPIVHRTCSMWRKLHTGMITSSLFGAVLSSVRIQSPQRARL